MVTILKLGLFMFSNFGFWEFFRSRGKVGVYFLPAFTIAVQFVVLFAAGLLNLLEAAAVSLYVLGLLLLLWALKKEKLQVFRPYINWGYAFLAAATAVIAVEVKDLQIADPDSIHHWSLVTNTMLLTNRFPNFMDTVITFQSYPLGSATCIYYFCRMTSYWEDIQLLGQGFIMLSMILPVFTYIRKNQAAGTLLVALLTNYLLCYNNDIRDLRVDTILPLVGAAMILFIYQGFWQEGPERMVVPVWYVVPFLCLTAQIKNSGLFFCLIAVIMLLAAKKKAGFKLLHAVAACLSPVAVSLLWKSHCDYVYERAAFSKHAMSSDWYGHILSQKKLEDYLAVIRGVSGYSINRADLKWILLWLAVLCVLALAVSRKNPRGYLKFLAGISGMYILYMIGIAGMYVVSMPRQESLAMGDITRYTRTIDVTIYYLIVCYMAQLLSRISSGRLRAAGSAAVLLLMVITWRGHYGKFATIFEESSQFYRSLEVRVRYQTLLDEYGVQPGCSYLVLEEEDPYGDSYFYIKYLMNTGEVYFLDITEESQLEIAKDCQYVFVFDYENPLVSQWVEENHPEQAGEAVVYNF